MTQADAAQRLGVSKRSVATYEGSGSVPMTVALACAAISLEMNSTAFFEQALREQYPSEDTVRIVLPFAVYRGALYENFVRMDLSREVAIWADVNTPSAKLVMRTIITPDFQRVEVGTVEFESATEAAIFKLRWC